MDLRFLLFFLGISFLTLLLVVFLGFWQATHPEKFTSKEKPSDFGWVFEDVRLITKDNLKLSGWFVPAKRPNVKSAIILLHGYPFDKGNLLSWTGFLHDDFNLLFFDFRYFGQSEGKFTSLGFYEREDVLAAISYLEKRGIEKIGLMGFSLGGSVALLTLGETDKISAVVSDSAFANLDLMAEAYYQNLWFLKKPLTQLTKIYARIFLQIEPDEIAPEKKVKGVKIPILIIHSREDELISIKHAQRLKEALKDNAEAQFWFQDRGIHGLVPAEVKKDYEDRILKFFKENLK